MELAGRIVLITGAARRVGRAIALRLASAGCRIALHYRRSKTEARETMAECREAGGEAALVRADLKDARAAPRLVREVVRHFGGLDVLINNASLFEPMDLDGFSLPAWERTLRVNLTAPMLLAWAARDRLRAAGGRIINLSDSAVARPWSTHVAYSVSKGALDTLTRVLARALAPDVNVVGVAPGVAAWPDHYDAATRRKLTRRIPLGRAGSPRDVAALVHFLLAEGDYITGTVVPVDGGRGLA
jgi:pteridine reductase